MENQIDKLLESAELQLKGASIYTSDPAVVAAVKTMLEALSEINKEIIAINAHLADMEV